MREAFEQSQRRFAVPTEEPLRGTEDSGDAVGLNTAFLQGLEISRPELVLHKDRYLRLQRLQEQIGVLSRSERQI